MRNSTPDYVLGIDPSGSFIEGKGTTGWCLFNRKLNKVTRCGSISATQYKTQEAYWIAHKCLIERYIEYTKNNMAVSVEDYRLYSNSARSQINSTLETSQLIGVIKVLCYIRGIKLYMRMAVAVKKRWADSILCHNNYIYKIGTAYFTECKSEHLCDHERDAIRHAVHCAMFELEKKNGGNS